MERRGLVSIDEDDREYLNDVMVRVRANAPAVDVELALRDGAADDPADLLRSVPALLKGSARAEARPHLRHGELTRREVEILGMVGQGQTDPQIAEALFISPKTASVHVANIKAKLGLESRIEVALRARELGSSRPTRRHRAAARALPGASLKHPTSRGRRRAGCRPA